MIYIFLSLFLLFVFTAVFLNTKSVLEPIAVSLLIMLGISGLIPFLCNEFLGMPYLKSSLEIFVSLFVILSVLFLLFGLGKIKHFSLPKIKIPEIVLLLTASAIIFRGYLLPMRGWDAFSLYDSRTVMFLSGTKLSQMAPFSKYDEFNQLYYFSYPPMTSVLHALIYSVDNSHVMLIYAIFYSVFMIYVYLFLQGRKLNKIIKLLIFIISAFNPLIFQHTKLAYTNLPALTFQFVSLYYLAKYSKLKNDIYLVLAAMFVGFSNWTRSLEPLFISFFIAFAYVVFLNKSPVISKILNLIKYLVISMFTWLIWHYFIKSTIGGLGETSPATSTIISAVFNSLLLSNLLNVIFFIYHAFFPIGLYIILAVIILMYFLLNLKKSVRIEEKTILIVLLITEAMMVGGTLYFSITFVWWDQIPDSFLRSNLILVPMIGVLCSYVLEDLKIKK